MSSTPSDNGFDQRLEDQGEQPGGDNDHHQRKVELPPERPQTHLLQVLVYQKPDRGGEQKEGHQLGPVDPTMPTLGLSRCYVIEVSSFPGHFKRPTIYPGQFGLRQRSLCSTESLR